VVKSALILINPQNLTKLNLFCGKELFIRIHGRDIHKQALQCERKEEIIE